MSVLTATANVIEWARNYIPDRTTKLMAIQDEEIGRTAIATNQRETFYLKHCPNSTALIYVEPYTYSATSSLSTVATNTKYYQYNATLQSVTFAAATEKPLRPAQFRAVVAAYNHKINLPYSYLDDELASYLTVAISYINNKYGLSYTYTGTISTLIPSYSTTNEKEILARALAITVRRAYAVEQQAEGFGVRIKGPLMTIDSVQAMKEYNKATDLMEEALSDKVDRESINNSGQVIDLYTENVVET